MRLNWFKAWGWVYRPVSWQGTALVLLTAAFCIDAIVAIDRHSHSVSDTLYGAFPFVAPAFLLLCWVASRTDGRPAA